MRKRSVVRIVSAALLALSACQDLPTPVEPSIPAPAAAQLDQGRHLGEVPFYCMQGRAAPSGWQTRRLTVLIPRGELNAGGRTVRYVYSRSFTDGRPFASATCVVPYTEGALRRLDRAFDVRENGGADQYRLRDGMVTTQGCVKDEVNGCPLEPIFVKPPPIQPATDPDDVCTRYPGECDDNSGGDGGDDWENGGSGDGAGDGTDGDLLDDDDEEIDAKPDCSKPHTLVANWQKAYCRATSPEGERLRRTTASLDAVKAKGGECENISAVGRQLLENGSLRYFDSIEGDAGGWGDPEIGVLMADRLVDNFGNEDNLNYHAFLRVLVHEIEHAMGRSHLMDAGGNELNDTANSQACSR